MDRPNPNEPCAFCGRKPHASLCDYPVRRKAIRRCSRRLCERCRTNLGDHIDFCPVHAEIIETAGIGDKLRPLLEQHDSNPVSRDVACDLIEQSAVIQPPVFRPKNRADWMDFVTERAAIFEYEGGFPREVAERKALALAGERPK